MPFARAYPFNAIRFCSTTCMRAVSTLTSLLWEKRCCPKNITCCLKYLVIFCQVKTTLCTFKRNFSRSLLRVVITWLLIRILSRKKSCWKAMVLAQVILMEPWTDRKSNVYLFYIILRGTRFIFELISPLFPFIWKMWGGERERDSLPNAYNSLSWVKSKPWAWICGHGMPRTRAIICCFLGCALVGSQITCAGARSQSRCS